MYRSRFSLRSASLALAAACLAVASSLAHVSIARSMTWAMPWSPRSRLPSRAPLAAQADGRTPEHEGPGGESAKTRGDGPLAYVP